MLGASQEAGQAGHSFWALLGPQPSAPAWGRGPWVGAGRAPCSGQPGQSDAITLHAQLHYVILGVLSALTAWFRVRVFIVTVFPGRCCLSHVRCVRWEDAAPAATGHGQQLRDPGPAPRRGASSWPGWGPSFVNGACCRPEPHTCHLAEACPPEACLSSLPCPPPGVPAGPGVGVLSLRFPAGRPGRARPTLLLLLFLPADTPSSPPHTQCFTPAQPSGRFQGAVGPWGKAPRRGPCSSRLSRHLSRHLPPGLAPPSTPTGHGRCPVCPPPATPVPLAPHGPGATAARPGLS